jgi:hypothetical protein
MDMVISENREYRHTENWSKIQNLKFGLKNQKSISFVKNRMIFLIYRMIFFCFCKKLNIQISEKDFAKN